MDYRLTYWSVRDKVMFLDMSRFRAAEAYAKQTGNPHDFMLFLVGA